MRVADVCALRDPRPLAVAPKGSSDVASSSKGTGARTLSQPNTHPVPLSHTMGGGVVDAFGLFAISHQSPQAQTRKCEDSKRGLIFENERRCVGGGASGPAEASRGGAEGCFFLFSANTELRRDSAARADQCHAGQGGPVEGHADEVGAATRADAFFLVFRDAGSRGDARSSLALHRVIGHTRILSAVAVARIFF
jgi:hypothetical protein